MCDIVNILMSVYPKDIFKNASEPYNPVGTSLGLFPFCSFSSIKSSALQVCKDLCLVLQGIKNGKNKLSVFMKKAQPKQRLTAQDALGVHNAVIV